MNIYYIYISSITTYGDSVFKKKRLFEKKNAVRSVYICNDFGQRAPAKRQTPSFQWLCLVLRLSHPTMIIIVTYFVSTHSDPRMHLLSIFIFCRMMFHRQRTVEAIQPTKPFSVAYHRKQYRLFEIFLGTADNIHFLYSAKVHMHIVFCVLVHDPN